MSEPSADFENVLYDVSENVATVTLNRPERLNAIDHGPGSMEDDLIRALELSDLRDDVRCTIVTGAGRAFSAGGHIGARVPKETAVDWFAFNELHDGSCERIRTMTKPSIGAINGVCYGSAFVLIAHLDLLVAVDHARLGLIETRFGSTGIEALPFLVGPHWAKFLALSGETITAAKAREIGLVLEVFPEGVFHYKVRDLARRIAAMPRDAVVLNRRVVNASVAAMGWYANKESARALNAVANSVAKLAEGVDGRRFTDVLEQDGWKAFKDLRDRAFTTPWLDNPAADR